MTPTALHSRQSDEWWTPPEVFDPLHEEFGFLLDVCAGTEEASRCEYFISSEYDGLAQRWDQGFEEVRAWCNPPYSSVAKWVAKAWQEAHHNGVTTVMLINNITETAAWVRYIDGCNPETGEYLDDFNAAEVRFVDGRIYYIAGCDMYNKDGKLTMRKGERGPAPKGSAVVVFRPGHVGPPVYSRFHQAPRK